MANALNDDLTGRYVILSEESMDEAYKAIEYRVFKVSGGFGASSFTIGTAVFGKTPYDGEKFRVDGDEIERFATDEEIELVEK